MKSFKQYISEQNPNIKIGIGLNKTKPEEFKKQIKPNDPHSGVKM